MNIATEVWSQEFDHILDHFCVREQPSNFSRQSAQIWFSRRSGYFDNLSLHKIHPDLGCLDSYLFLEPLEAAGPAGTNIRPSNEKATKTHPMRTRKSRMVRRTIYDRRIRPFGHASSLCRKKWDPLNSHNLSPFGHTTIKATGVMVGEILTVRIQTIFLFFCRLPARVAYQAVKQFCLHWYLSWMSEGTKILILGPADTVAHW